MAMSAKLRSMKQLSEDVYKVRGKRVSYLRRQLSMKQWIRANLYSIYIKSM